MKREVFEPFVADVVQKQLASLVPHPAADALAPFVTGVVTEAMRGKSDEKITGRGTLSTKGVAKTVIQAAHRTYLQGRDLTPESVFTMDNIEAVAPRRGKDAGAKRLSLVKAAEMFLGESLGPQAREVEKTYDKPYLPKDFPRSNTGRSHGRPNFSVSMPKGFWRSVSARAVPVLPRRISARRTSPETTTEPYG